MRKQGLRNFGIASPNSLKKGSTAEGIARIYIRTAIQEAQDFGQIGGSDGFMQRCRARVGMGRKQDEGS
jgi:hypothetical protein